MSSTWEVTSENLSFSSEVLIGILSDEMVLYVKTRNAHWRVGGMDFFTMHLLFKKQYEELDQIIDDVAERIRTLSHYPPTTMKEYLELTHLKEQCIEKNTSVSLIELLLTDHESLINLLRKNLHQSNEGNLDAGTSDFLSNLLTRHEKTAWILKSHIHS